VSSLDWMPEDLLNHSRAFSAIVDSLIELYFPSLWTVKLQTSKQVTPKSDTDLGTREKTRGGRSRHALKRQRLDDRSDSHTSPHLESTNRHSALGILPASVVVGITNPIVRTTDKYTTQLSASNHVLVSANSTRKRQKTRDGGAFCKILTFKITNAVIKVNQPQRDGSAGLDDVLNRPQPEHHNIAKRPYTFPNEQARDSASVGAALMITSSVDADNHDSHALQPSGQDRLERSHSSTLPSPTSQGVMDSSAPGLVGSGLGSTPVVLARQDSSSRTSVCVFLGLIILICCQTSE
jgi:hypothetical protein